MFGKLVLSSYNFHLFLFYSFVSFLLLLFPLRATVTKTRKDACNLLYSSRLAIYFPLFIIPPLLRNLRIRRRRNLFYHFPSIICTCSLVIMTFLLFVFVSPFVTILYMIKRHVFSFFFFLLFYTEF